MDRITSSHLSGGDEAENRDFIEVIQNMTAEEVLSDLFDKYGKNFNWYMIPFAQANFLFIRELSEALNKNWRIKKLRTRLLSLWVNIRKISG